MKTPDRYAVIGHPVAHSLSPRIHALFAAQTGERLSYERIDATPERFADSVHEFLAGGGSGLNVTLPHKQAARALCSHLTGRARRAAAVNTLKAGTDGTLLGDNTDGAGLVRDLRINLQLSIAGQHLLLIGAGGAVRGVLGPLLAEQPAGILIANRTASRAAELAAEFSDDAIKVRGSGLDLMDENFDLIINGTSASLAGELPSLPRGLARAGTVCYDMAYGHEETVFVRWARSQGVAMAVMGLGMLVEQAAESFLLWRGVRPETLPVLEALRHG
jgi:shikimate dehydrogenase